ncbi:HupE/UreJ family protein [Jeongeupia wiesaeckerbachi]|uniref:HupE/UreJ family protein n=1 Tax=Jeongeupia wiesaeckerbachi TaxID=3051218 RepID=UPI003D807AAD
MRHVPTLAALLLPGLWPAMANAHAAFAGAGDFYAGALHPLTSPEHVMLLLALGLLAGQNGRQRAAFLLAVFPLAVLAGAVLAQYWPAPPYWYAVNVVSAIVTGVLLALARPLPRVLLGGVEASAGLAFGIANGAAIEGQMLASAFVPGIVIVAFLALAYLMAAGDALPRRGWVAVALRVAGSWTVAIGVLVLSLADRQWGQS